MDVLPANRYSFIHYSFAVFIARLRREIDLFSLFPVEVPGELDPLSFHKLCVDMQVKRTKFERNSSLECYHMTCLGKTNIQATEVYCQFLSVMENVNKRRRNYISLSGTSLLGIQLKKRLRLKELKFTFAALSSLDLKFRHHCFLDLFQI